MCENTATVYVPKGYDYKPVQMRCGSTDYNGDRVICDQCASDKRAMAEIERQERNAEADNAWLRSAGWGEM